MNREINNACTGFYSSHSRSSSSTSSLSENDVSRDMRQIILRNFNCPFRRNALGCLHELYPESCLFGHPTTKSDELTLPKYLCRYQVMGMCTKMETSNRYGSNSRRFDGCDNGAHIDLLQLLDIKKLDFEFGCTTPSSEINECCICLETVRTGTKFALLEKCDHCFCAGCYISYRNSRMVYFSSAIPCPICRAASKRFYLSDKFIRSNEKARLFSRYVCSCVGH